MPLADHRIVIFGGGTAGIGIADLLRDELIRAGVPREEAIAQFYALGSKGLFVDDMPMLREFQRPYARSRAEVEPWNLVEGSARGIRLADVVRNVRPTIMIGTSTVGGAFSKAIVKDMAAHCERPIIMPLSNPTSRAEATPGDLIEWTDGHALIATGSPFEPVDHREVRHFIAQANNALIFPGLGLGVAACQATRVTDRMIAAAAEALAARVNTYRPGAALLPSMSELRPVSSHVALAVAAAAAEEGVARQPLTDPINEIYSRMWQPAYSPVEVV